MKTYYSHETWKRPDIKEWATYARMYMRSQSRTFERTLALNGMIGCTAMASDEEKPIIRIASIKCLEARHAIDHRVDYAGRIDYKG